MNNGHHQPVLVKETIAMLKIRHGGKYIDATLGGGGHTKKILESGGLVLGIDRDPEALEKVKKDLSEYIKEKKLIVYRGSFENLDTIAGENGFGEINGILFDLGMSSDQFESGRGFSFMKDEPLDMRMDPDLGVTAADLANALSQKELFGLFTKLAQVERAREIAGAIVKRRRLAPIKTTRELVKIIESVPVRRRQTNLHPATKVFMALRIAVNNELENLEKALPQACGLLEIGGRLAVISFHQGEDKIVKWFIRQRSVVIPAKEGIYLDRSQVKQFDSPMLTAEVSGMTEVNKEPIMASAKEVQFNPGSRSAKLRVAEKL